MIDFGKLNYESLGLNFNELVSVEFNDHVIDNLISNIVNTQKSNTEQLTIQDDFKTINIDELTLSSKIERCKFEISKIQDLFTGEQREYQQYLVALARWESGKKSIIGESTQSGTLSYINEMIRYITDDLLIELTQLRKDRILKSRKIFTIKSEIKDFYDEVKLEIDNKLNVSDVSGLNIC
ncbi:hypothetical protein ACU5DF_10565 [Aliivibrio wodanis]|uniref:hypothetical protein n=1 Tax=Aliivibrio wodanis TaxID=80852 RepID=UPI00406D2D59